MIYTFWRTGFFNSFLFYFLGTFLCFFLLNQFSYYAHLQNHKKRADLHSDAIFQQDNTQGKKDEANPLVAGKGDLDKTMKADSEMNVEKKPPPTENKQSVTRPKPDSKETRPKLDTPTPTTTTIGPSAAPSVAKEREVSTRTVVEPKREVRTVENKDKEQRSESRSSKPQRTEGV